MRTTDPLRPTLGHVDRDGIRLAYDVRGAGDTTVLLLPAWAISTSAIWQQQVDELAGRCRVVTYDPRGNGGSDRPTDPDAHALHLLLGDALAVLDAVGADRAVVAGNSYGALVAYLLAALHPSRVEGVVLIGPSSLPLDGRTDDPFQRALLQFDLELGVDDGWDRFNRRSWRRDFPGFVRWFAETAFPEPEADALRAAGVASGLDAGPAVLRATIDARAGTDPVEAAARLRDLAPAVRCPALVVQGALDAIAPLHRAEAAAALLDAPLVVVDGAGHCPQATRPAEVGALLAGFLDEVEARSAVGLQAVH